MFITTAQNGRHYIMYPIKPFILHSTSSNSAIHPQVSTGATSQEPICVQPLLLRWRIWTDSPAGHRGWNNQHTPHGGNHFILRHLGLLIPEGELSHDAITFTPFHATGPTAARRVKLRRQDRLRKVPLCSLIYREHSYKSKDLKLFLFFPHNRYCQIISNCLGVRMSMQCLGIVKKLRVTKVEILIFFLMKDINPAKRELLAKILLKMKDCAEVWIWHNLLNNIIGIV